MTDAVASEASVTLKVKLKGGVGESRLMPLRSLTWIFINTFPSRS